MQQQAQSTRAAILSAAEVVFRNRPDAPLEQVAKQARVSRTTFYNHFRSRGELLVALEIEPDPNSRTRILRAAAELIGRDGLAGLSMDELATVAEVSRTSVYRLFPGKAALFEAVIDAFSPFTEIVAHLEKAAAEPPEVVLPDLYRIATPLINERIGIVRVIFLEVTSGSADALAGANRPLRAMLQALGAYLERQMAAGRVRRMNPMTAAHVLIGPIFFHLMTRVNLVALEGFDEPLDASSRQMAAAVSRGLLLELSGGADL